MFRYALGLHDFAEYELVPRTYYNFKKRLVEYEESSKINLMELLFKNLNDSIKTKYNISTKEERMDSTLIWSNIKNMSRLELCLKTFKKFYSSIQDNEKDEKIEKYIESDSDNFCYKLKKEEVEKELEKIGYILYKYYQRYIENEKVQKTEEFKLIERLFYEQFEIENDQVKAKDIAKMRQLKLCCYKDKIRFRRQKNIRIVFIALAIALNFKRINGYLNELNRNLGKISENLINFFKYFSIFHKFNNFLLLQTIFMPFL